MQPEHSFRRQTAVISQVEEESIINRVLGGEQEAYARLVTAYKSYAFTIAYKILQTRQEAEEAAQDAFVKAYQHLRSFNRQSRFATWLYRIVFNTAVSYRRKRKVVLSGLEYNDKAGDEDRGMEQSDQSQFVAQAMEKLSEADRLALQLYYLKEFPLDDVAEMMGHNMNTLKVRIHRARQRLAVELTKILREEALTL